MKHLKRYILNLIITTVFASVSLTLWVIFKDQTGNLAYYFASVGYLTLLVAIYNYLAVTIIFLQGIFRR